MYTHKHNIYICIDIDKHMQIYGDEYSMSISQYVYRKRNGGRETDTYDHTNTAR